VSERDRIRVGGITVLTSDSVLCKGPGSMMGWAELPAGHMRISNPGPVHSTEPRVQVGATRGSVMLHRVRVTASRRASPDQPSARNLTETAGILPHQTPPGCRGAGTNDGVPASAGAPSRVVGRGPSLQRDRVPVVRPAGITVVGSSSILSRSRVRLAREVDIQP
jgi:hypothetical protein